MKIIHKLNIKGEHSIPDLETLKSTHGYNFTEEHIEFIRAFPGACFDGSRIVKITTENTIGDSTIHNFLSASDILYVLSDEAIMEAFEDIPKTEIGEYCILAFSHTETELFLVGSEPSNKNNIYVYSSITDETILICNGVKNFINNFLYND